MRTAILAAALAITACTDDAVDPAWTTPGAAAACVQDPATTPDLPVHPTMAGSYFLSWACRGSGNEGTDPCDPGLNPLLRDSEVEFAAIGDGYMLRIDGNEIALSGTSSLSSGVNAIDGEQIAIVVSGCAGTESIMMKVVSAGHLWHALMARQ